MFERIWVALVPYKLQEYRKIKSMAYLNNFTIPLISQTAKSESEPTAPPPPIIGAMDDTDTTAANSDPPQYEHPDRFIPPGRKGSEWFHGPSKRKYPKQTQKFKSEITRDGELILFPGRDASYPDDLNILIHPLECDLCKVKMNSFRPANDHYRSKAHFRAVTMFLMEKGLNPPETKKVCEKKGITGPNAYHCDLCDLSLTSLAHAQQHYAGRKHKLVASKKSDPKGAGYYNDEGKWVRTSSHFTPTVANDGRFGIGEQFKSDTEPQAGDVNTDADGSNAGDSNAGDSPDTKDSSIKIKVVKPRPPVKESLYCKICEVPTSSEQQMKAHLEGAKHKKKLKQANIDATIEPPVQKAADSILDSLKDENDSAPKVNADVSMFRTPSGSFYCKICDISIPQEIVLRQHLAGKKHIKKVAAAASNPDTSEATTTE